MHNGIGVVAARPYKPRDKAKVDSGVLLVQRWIIAALRNQKFFSIEELNQAIQRVSIPWPRTRFSSRVAVAARGTHLEWR
jgi:transposase